MTRVSERFARFSWGTLAVVVGVILWGALVRATSSGDGCGSHWPMCNGEVLPPSPTTKTVIELTHRVTSGASALMVLAQLIWSRYAFPRGHRVRGAVVWASAFMIAEVFIGAGIVLLKYVGDNPSLARAGWMALHLVNTFLLLGALTLTARYASGGAAVSLRGRGAQAAMAIAVLAGTIVVGASGAVAALGDTLFPSTGLVSALSEDLSPTAHVLVRLRVLHPFLAVAVAFLVLLLRHVLAARGDARMGLAVRVIVIAQLAAGLVNMMLLAPTWLQLVHLFLADALWISLVLFVASAFAAEEAAEAPHLTEEVVGAGDPAA
jgi:cytochrome c oxidase assembly protein subunit 15